MWAAMSLEEISRRIGAEVPDAVLVAWRYPIDWEALVSFLAVVLGLAAGFYFVATLIQRLLAPVPPKH